MLHQVKPPKYGQFVQQDMPDIESNNINKESGTIKNLHLYKSKKTQLELERGLINSLALLQ
jgi:hypothetical protein